MEIRAVRCFMKASLILILKYNSHLVIGQLHIEGRTEIEMKFMGTYLEFKIC
jgi:hypothetical protein